MRAIVKKKEGIWAQGVMRGSEAYVKLWDTGYLWDKHGYLCSGPKKSQHGYNTLKPLALWIKSRLLHLKPLPLY